MLMLPPDYAVEKRLEAMDQLMPSPGPVDMTGGQDSWISEKVGDALRGMGPWQALAGIAALFGVLTFVRK